MNENDIIIELANRLGIVVEEIFTIFSESIRGIAVLNMISLVVSCIGVYLIFKFACAFVKKIQYNNRTEITYIDFDSDDWAGIAIICIFMALVWIIFVIEMSCCVSNYMFPEYEAIKQMLMILSRN